MDRFWSNYFGFSERARGIREALLGPLERSDTGLFDVVHLVLFYALFVLAAFWLCGNNGLWPGLIKLSIYFIVPTGTVIAFVLLANVAHAGWANLRKGHGAPDVPSGPEPAFRNYFFGNARQDLRLIVLQATNDNRTALKEIWSAIMLLIANSVLPLLWLPGFILGIGLVIATGLAIAVAAVITAAQLAAIVVIGAIILGIAHSLRAAEFGIVRVRRWFIICPNSGCYKPVGLPVYRCRHCGAEHKQLVPGEYGILQRRCSCKQRIGTLRISGRDSLPSFCPHADCGKPLPTGVEKFRSIHILLVGGRNAGKTTLLAATLYALARRAERDAIALQIPKKAHRETLALYQQLIEFHQFPSATHQRLPEAFVAYLQDWRRRRAALYVYDPAGEAFQQKKTLLGQNFQKIVCGLMFLIDPYSVRSFLLEFPERTAAANVSSEDPEAIYAREIAALRQTKGEQGAFVDVAIAMIVTKADSLSLRKDLDAKQWLMRYGHSNLVRTVESDFSKVRYFFTSVNPAEAETASFAAPADWLLSLSDLDVNANAGVLRDSGNRERSLASTEGSA
jgi:hypothetical protein